MMTGEEGSIMRIVTARLVLRDFVEDDAPAFLAYQSDPRYAALHGPGEADPSHTRCLLQRFERCNCSTHPSATYHIESARLSLFG